MSIMSFIESNMENTGEIVVYEQDETTRLEVRMQAETVWLNRHQIAQLFGRDIKTIGKHINNALKEELSNIPTVANFAIVQEEGARWITRYIEHYNLDMIISIGYRVKSQKGVLFRRWANEILKEYLLKGIAINQRIASLENRVEEKFIKYDRFLIIDDKVYLVGASIKDLGKKWFGFTLMENTDAEELLGRI